MNKNPKDKGPYSDDKKRVVEIIKVPPKEKFEKFTLGIQIALLFISLFLTGLIAYRGWIISGQLASANIDQQKIAWSISLLPQLSSESPLLQRNASLVLKDLNDKGMFPTHLLPTLAHVLLDPKIDPDAAKILKDLLKEKNYPFYTRLGSNVFNNCLFPLSLNKERFFFISRENGQYAISIIVNAGDHAEFELIRNVPNSNSTSNIFRAKNGALVASNMEDGNIIYKMTTSPNIAITYYQSTPKPIPITIAEKLITIGGVNLSNNQFTNFDVGIIVDKKGGISLGSNYAVPPVVKKLFDQVHE